MSLSDDSNSPAPPTQHFNETNGKSRLEPFRTYSVAVLCSWIFVSEFMKRVSLRSTVASVAGCGCSEHIRKSRLLTLDDGGVVLVLVRGVFEKHKGGRAT